MQIMFEILGQPYFPFFLVFCECHGLAPSLGKGGS